MNDRADEGDIQCIDGSTFNDQGLSVSEGWEGQSDEDCGEYHMPYDGSTIGTGINDIVVISKVVVFFVNKTGKKI